MRAEFTPDNHYAGLLAQAKALFRITQSQEAIISTLRSKLTELESQLAMVGTAEIEAQRAANEQLTNEVERLTAHNANLQTAVDAGLRQSYMLREFASQIGISDREDPLETLIGGWTRAAEAMRNSLNEHNRMWKEVLQTRHEHRQMAAQNKRLINCFTTLMEHSTGVAGLHLNGDVAPWSELTEGGRFEEWLLPLSEPRDQSIDALEAQWQAEAIPGFIREMGERLRTQDNRITADPLFCVFEKDYVVAEEGYGHDRIDWGDIRDEYTLIDPDSDKWHRLESLYQAGREVGDNYQRNAVKLVDKFVTAAFTEAGANDHIRMNGHNLRKPFVYVTSLFRTPEMIELREWLKAQEAAKEQQ